MTDPSVTSVIKDWLSIVSVGGTILLALAVLYLRDKFVLKEAFDEERKVVHARIDAKASSDRVEAVVSILDKLEARVAVMDGNIAHLPTKESVHEMAIALTKLGGDVRALSERLGPIQKTTERLQEFLLEQAK